MIQPSTRSQTIANLNASFDATEALMDSLSADDWAVQSLCPEWDTRGVILHLTGIEHALTGWVPSPDAPPFDKIGPWIEAASDWSNEELVAAAKQIYADRRAEVAAMSDEVFAADAMTPVGPGTYHRFMDIRVFDFWVHERDISTPLGRATSDGGPTAERSLDEVHMSIGYIVGKKIGLPDGMSIAFRLSGPVQRDIYAAVEGRAAGVDHVDDPSVEVHTDSTTFIQLACGRIEPQGAIDAGKITWSGSADGAAEWGEKAARNLRFTM